MSTKPNTCQITYDTGSNKQDLNSILDTVVPIADYTALRNYTGRATQARITSDGIAGFFKYDSTNTTSTDNGGTIIVAGTKRWKRIFDSAVNVKWFGAVGDGVTDDTVAIQLAINATPNGGTLYFPAGVCLVSSGLLCSVPIRIIGDGMTSTAIAVSGSVSAGTDVLTLQGALAGDAATGFYVADLRIMPVSGTPARHAINMGNGGDISRATVERVRIGNFGNYGILNNGAFSSTIQDSIVSGISFDKCTDNQNVLNNTLVGKFWGVHINAVPGTNMFNVKDNVIVSKLGGVKVIDAGTLTIADNQFETQDYTTDTDYSQVLLIGYARQLYNVQIHGNNFNTSFNFKSAIKVKNAAATCIFGNTFFCGTFDVTGQKCIDIGSDADGTVLHNNNAIGPSGVADHNITQRAFSTEYDATFNTISFVFDSGLATSGVWKFMKWSGYPVISETGYYSAAGGANCLPAPGTFPLAKYRKTADGFMVEFTGGMTFGDKTERKLIHTMPANFRPPFSEVGGTVISIAPVVGLVGGGSAYAMAISVDSLGAMTLRGGDGISVTPTFLSLEGASYQVTF